jgi:hypothetical protein
VQRISVRFCFLVLLKGPECRQRRTLRVSTELVWTGKFTTLYLSSGCLSAGKFWHLLSKARCVLNFSPLAFADKTLEDAFILVHQTVGSSAGVTIYASPGIFWIIYLGISPTDRSDLIIISHIGFLSMALILMITQQTFFLKYIQVIRVFHAC